MPVTTLSREDGVELAYDLLPGNGPVVVFLPGFASDMGGTKAIFLRNACAERGQAMLRLDYSGHGISQGRFEDGSIGDWANDAASIIETATRDAPLLLVGSSMGGWIALLLALRFAARLRAMLLIAPAPDFTETMILPNLTPQHRDELARTGRFYPPSEYGDPIPITQRLLDDGRNHLLLGGKIPIHCPVHVLHGMRDPDVPWQNSLKLSDCLATEAMRLILIKDGDHRLSRAQDLSLLRTTLWGLLGENSP